MTKEQAFSALQSLNYIYVTNNHLLSLEWVGNLESGFYRSTDLLFDLLLSDFSLLLVSPSYENHINYEDLNNINDLKIWLDFSLSNIY